ncbi:hypothetical protein [Moritella sp. F3]|uniref:hypothetical protein n=1 Tax=Moritella sp. F3 TaxID=2718882 RepID=UPI0018E15FE6|nr:hypothetical protein [Moritella sp. F3]GIC79476.1 hypothetical protein FMO001_42030 [Moritella sp. F1]GIC79754.1 hypothetical protein FMO003_00350 [Moritella sp. F3]
METVQSVINEIMFIATSRPDAIDITVEYSGVSDSLSVKVMPRGFDYINTTTESYEASILYHTNVWLNDSGPMQAALDAKCKILELIAMPVNIEVAA